MKCKNCSGNYRTRELKCPYCGTPNGLGRLWQVERNEAELEYEKTRKELPWKASPYVMNRALGRIIVIEVAFVILFFLGVAASFFLEEKLTQLSFSMNRDKVEAQMEEYWSEGDYESLDRLFEKYGLYGNQDYYVYKQAYILSNTRDYFRQRRLDFLGQTEEEKQSNEYQLEMCLRYASDIITVDCGVYSELQPENQTQYDSYCEEIRAFLVGMLGMTDEEIELLQEPYFESDASFDELLLDITEREAWLEWM